MRQKLYERAAEVRQQELAYAMANNSLSLPQDLSGLTQAMNQSPIYHNGYLRTNLGYSPATNTSIMANPSTYYTYGTGSTGSAVTTTATGQIVNSNSAFYMSDEDGWSDVENQAAAGCGWMLTHDYSSHPRLHALTFGVKKSMTDQEILTDVIEQAMGGENPIAYKILCVLSKNRSPYASWAKTAEALEKTYDTSK